MANIFYFHGVHSIEEELIMEMLRRSGDKDSSCDTRTILGGHDEAIEMNMFFRGLTTGKDKGYLMPEVPTEQLKRAGLMDHLTVLSQDNIPGGMSLVHQYAAIVGRRLTRYEDLVGIFAKSGILRMIDAGASEEEVKTIALRDRLIRGGTLEDEAVAAELAREMQPARVGKNSKCELEAYTLGQGFLDSRIARSLVDYLVYRNGVCGQHLLLFLVEKMLDDNVTQARILLTHPQDRVKVSQYFQSKQLRNICEVKDLGREPETKLYDVGLKLGYPITSEGLLDQVAGAI